MTVLDKVNYPNDIKKLSIAELDTLADEMRQLIIKKVNTTGGHMGPNLGFVEPTIAMHYVFDTPKDKIVYDVSHQCYPHKILTGRKEGFTNPQRYLDFSGYTNPEESEYDCFVVGHTSTSVTLAAGLAKSRDLKGDKENVIAVLGDGSLSGGEALEGLNNAAVLGSNIIIVFNDNEMSIAPNHGGMYENIRLLRETNGQAECNFFKAMGFDYYYVEEGNNTQKLIEVFEKVKGLNHPVLVHIHTLKGKGLLPAEQNKEAFHWIMPGTLDKKDDDTNSTPTENYTSVTVDYILNKAKQDPTVFAISPATPGAYGFTPDVRAQLGNQYTDVGIAEEHAVAFASAMAKNGTKPILLILSSFIQRTYDQLSQDLCLNNSPATILVHWGAITGADMTHLGCFDIPLVSNIPNIVYLAPTNKEEYIAMMDWSLQQTQHPVAIRVPFGNFVTTGIEDKTDYSILNKYSVVKEGAEIAILGLGSFFEKAEDLAKEIHKALGINATVINPKFITGVDEQLLDSLKQNHKLVVTLEDGVLDGGFGEKIARYYGTSEMKVLNFGARKEFTDRVPLEEIYERNHLTTDLMIQDIKSVL